MRSFRNAMVPNEYFDFLYSGDLFSLRAVLYWHPLLSVLVCVKVGEAAEHNGKRDTIIGCLPLSDREMKNNVESSSYRTSIQKNRNKVRCSPERI